MLKRNIFHKTFKKIPLKKVLDYDNDPHIIYGLEVSINIFRRFSLGIMVDIDMKSISWNISFICFNTIGYWVFNKKKFLKK